MSDAPWQYVYGETAERHTTRVYRQGNVGMVKRARWSRHTGETSSIKTAYFSFDDPEQCEYPTLKKLERAKHHE